MRLQVDRHLKPMSPKFHCAGSQIPRPDRTRLQRLGAVSEDANARVHVQSYDFGNWFHNGIYL
jgi:hypothetical protein